MLISKIRRGGRIKVNKMHYCNKLRLTPRLCKNLQIYKGGALIFGNRFIIQKSQTYRRRSTAYYTISNVLLFASYLPQGTQTKGTRPSRRYALPLYSLNVPVPVPNVEGWTHVSCIPQGVHHYNLLSPTSAAGLINSSMKTFIAIMEALAISRPLLASLNREEVFQNQILCSWRKT